MPCLECARLESRIADLRQLHSHASADHLRAVQFGNTEGLRRYEEAMFGYSEAIKRAEERLANHRCGVDQRLGVSAD
jgi:hypothetical protein